MKSSYDFFIFDSFRDIVMKYNYKKPASFTYPKVPFNINEYYNLMYISLR